MRSIVVCDVHRTPVAEPTLPNHSAELQRHNIPPLRPPPTRRPPEPLFTLLVRHRMHYQERKSLCAPVRIQGALFPGLPGRRCRLNECARPTTLPRRRPCCFRCSLFVCLYFYQVLAVQPHPGVARTLATEFKKNQSWKIGERLTQGLC